MDTDFVTIVAYSCPRCHATLEARSIGSPTWLRCPACGRACLPPEYNRNATSPYIDNDAFIIGDVITDGKPAPLPMRPRGMAPMPAPEPAKTPTTRLLLGTGFFLTTILFVFSLLDSNGVRAVFFGCIAVVCLILLSRQSRRSSDV